MKLLGMFIGICIVFTAMAIAAILDGFATSVLWGWFMVPLFKLPSLPISAAIGIAALIGLLTRQHIPDPKEKSESNGKNALFDLFVSPFIAILIGYICKQSLP